MKRFLSIMLALLLVFSFIPATALADENTVATIGEEKYDSLFGAEGALAAAKNGDTIVLVKDSLDEEADTVTIDGNITLDLAGNTIVQLKSNPIFIVNGKLVVRSTVDGAGEENTAKKAKFFNTGTVAKIATANATFDASNVDFRNTKNAALYGENLLEGHSWRSGHYASNNGVYQSYASRVCLDKVIDVEKGETYSYDTGNSSYKFIVRGYDASGNFKSSVINASSGTLTINDNCVKLGVSLYENVTLAMIDNGTVKPTINKVGASYASTGTTGKFIDVTVDGVTVKMDNCATSIDTWATDYYTFDKGVTFDVKDSAFEMPNLGGVPGMQLNSDGIHGTFKNTSITGSNRATCSISKTSEEGLTFDNCTFKGSGDSGSALTVNGGIVNLTNGTTLNGSSSAKSVLSISGGTVTADDVKLINNGVNAASYLLIYKNGGTFKLGKATLTRPIKESKPAGAFVADNSITTLYSYLNDGYAVYSSSETSTDTIQERTADISSYQSVYVDVCGHYCTSAQGTSTTCAYCGAENADIQHDYSIIKDNEDSHWYVCAICDSVSLPEAHKGGTATCTKKAVCEVCKREYGEPNGHTWGDYTVDETKGCEHNTVKVRECSVCHEKDYDYSQAQNVEVTQQAVAPDCTQKGYTQETKCTECGKTIQERTEIEALGHDWGNEVVDKEPTYVKVGSAHRDCKRCDAVDKYDLPVKKIPAKYAFAVTDADGDVTSEDQLFISFADAIDAIEAGSTILVMRDFSTGETLTVDKAFTLDLQGHSFTSANTNGVIKTTADFKLISSSLERANVTFNKAFIVSSATVTIDNVKAIASTAGSIFNSSAATAKFVVTNSVIGKDDVSGFSISTPCEIDISDSEIRGCATFNNAGLFGVIKNTKFYRNNNVCADIKNTSSEGIELQNCNCSQGGWDTTVFNATGGKCKLTGGTVIDGNNRVNTVLYVSNATVEINDATIKGDKSDGTSKKLINFASGTVKVYKAKFELGTNNSQSLGLITNSDAVLKGFLAEGCCLYKGADATEENAYRYDDAGFVNKKTLYVDECAHNCTLTQGDSTTCAYCNLENAPIVHDYSIVKHNGDTHWYVCAKCDKVSEPEAHKGGEATCTEKAKCEVCGVEYGEPNGHTWGEFTVDETKGCEHNVVKVRECTVCHEKDYDYSQAEANIEVTQAAVAPSCTEKGYTKETKCTECGKTIQERTEIAELGHDWGDEVVDTEPTYETEGAAHRDCSRCDTVDRYSLPKNVYPARYSFAIPDENGKILVESQLYVDLASALAAVEEKGTIALIKDVALSSLTTTDKAFTLDLAGFTLNSSNSGGAIKTTANLNIISTSDDRAKVNFNKAFVVSSATFTMDNVNAEATTAGSIFNSSADTAKFVATNCIIGTNGVSGLAFTTAFEFDISDSEIRGGATFENAGLFGVIKNTKFYRSNGVCTEVKKTSDEGIEFQGCSCSQGAWDSTVFTVSGGKCKLTGGTVIDGTNKVSRVLNVTGGTVEINDANLKGDKGLDTGRRLIYYSGGTVKIYKVKFELGTNQGKYDGIISNDDATLRSFLAEGHCFFNSSDATDENAFEYTTENLIHKKVLYVDVCGDWDTTATCTTAGKCTFCNKDMDALGHNFQWNCDDTNHWKECTRCELVQEGTTEAHTAGAKATCTHGTTCEVCGLFYGEALGHDIAKDNEGNFIYGYDSNSHWKTCTRCDEHIDTQSHSGGTATCTEKAVCEFCGLEYGEPLGHSFVTYVSNNDATCTRDGTKTAVCAHGCGATDTIDDVGSMKAHNIVEDPAVAATCNSMGKTAGSHCADCGKVIVEQNWIAVNPNAHDWDSGVTTPATCKAKGKIVYTCANCGKTEEVELPIDPNAHVLSTTSKAATYFAAGYKNRKVCKLCGKVVSAGTKIAKKVLAKPTKSTVKAGKGQFTVKYKKVKGATGFQVRYRIKGKWIVKTFNTKKNASKVIKKLAKGKYTVQIRAMVKKGSKKAYSKWAKAKKVTVK